MALRRTKEQAAETRLQILNCAESLFIEKGYDNATLEEIALAAGVTRGAVHWHFANKEGLLVAIRDKSQLLFEEIAENLAGSSTPPTDAVLNAFDDLFGRINNDLRRKSLLRVTILYELSRLPALTSPHRSFVTIMEKIFKAADKRGELREDWSSRDAAVAFTAIVSSVFEEWALERSELKLVPAGQKLIRASMTLFIKKIEK